MAGKTIRGLGIFLLLGLTAGVIILILNWDRALGPALPSSENPTGPPSSPPIESITASPTGVISGSPTAIPPTATLDSDTLEDLAKPTATPAPAPTPVCGGPPQLLVLAIGTDSRPNNYLYGLGDVIRLVRLDFLNKKIEVLSIPRDLWVEIPKIKKYGITHGKLSQAFSWGTEGMGYYQSEAGGAGLLALTLEHNFDLHVDHYFTVNMKTFKKMVNHIGGIYLYVPQTLDGRVDKSQPREPKYGYFEAGEYYMDGTAALSYARIRKMDSDFYRQERQSQLLRAIWKRVLSPDIVETVPDLIEYFRSSVLTDLSLEQMTQISCLVLSLEERGIAFSKLERDLFTDIYTQTNEMALTADFDMISQIFKDFIAGKGRH